MASAFRGVIEFFVRLGIYDVVLPFLLVFTIIFAIFEKTKVLGTEKVGGEMMPKKNLNAMAAFVIAFLVVASSRLVAIVNETMANMVILILLSVCFLLLIGSFQKETKEGVYLEGGWKTLFTIIMFVGITLIFLNALGWLEVIWKFLINNWDGNVAASVVLFGLVAGVMYWITKDQAVNKETKS